MLVLTNERLLIQIQCLHLGCATCAHSMSVIRAGALYGSRAAVAVGTAAPMFETSV